MTRNRIQIGEMRLRANGLSREQARHLGNVVAKRLAELPASSDRTRAIPTMNVRVNSSDTSSVEGMADAIVTGIRRSLK